MASFSVCRKRRTSASFETKWKNLASVQRSGQEAGAHKARNHAKRDRLEQRERWEPPEY